MQVIALPTHTVSSYGTVTQRYTLYQFLACLCRDILLLTRFISLQQGGFLSMAKKKKVKRIRSFKVNSDGFGIPFVRFGGKYLYRELGLNIGDRLELIHEADGIKLRKFSAEEVNQYEAQQEYKALLRNLFPLVQKKQASSMMVAESRTPYTIDDELIRQHEKLLQDLKN